MQSPSFDRSQWASAVAFVAGGLVWAVAWLVGSEKEAWDFGYYYVVAVVAPFLISLASYQWKGVVGNWFFGQLLYLATFGVVAER